MFYNNHYSCLILESSEEALLQQAMTLDPDEGMDTGAATSGPDVDTLTEEQQIALALQMSLQDGRS